MKVKSVKDKANKIGVTTNEIDFIITTNPEVEATNSLFK